MKKLLLIIFCLQFISSSAQTFHTSFSDYHFMQPADFLVLEDGYISSVNYGFAFIEKEYAMLIKTDLAGNRTASLELDVEHLMLQGLKQLNDTVQVIYGVIWSQDNDYPLLYMALVNNELELVKQFKFEANKIAIANSVEINARACVNNSGNIICVLNNLGFDEEAVLGTYVFKFDDDLNLLNKSFSPSSGDKSCVDDILAINNSDTCLMVGGSSSANFLVDGNAYVIDTLPELLHYENGYPVFFNFALGVVGETIYLAGRNGSSESAVVKFDKDLNRLDTRFFGEEQEHCLVGLFNTLAVGEDYLYTFNIDYWSISTIYYGFENTMSVRKIDTALNLIWEKEYFFDGTCFMPMSIRATPDGGFAILATRNHYDTMGDQVEAYFIKADSMGYFDTTTVGLIEEISNARVYPNPGNDYLTFDIATEQECSYLLYSLDGKAVISEKAYAKHTLNTTELNNGIYFYKVMLNGVLLHQGKWMKE